MPVTTVICLCVKSPSRFSQERCYEINLRADALWLFEGATRDTKKANKQVLATTLSTSERESSTLEAKLLVQFQWSFKAFSQMLWPRKLGMDEWLGQCAFKRLQSDPKNDFAFKLFSNMTEKAYGMVASDIVASDIVASDTVATSWSWFVDHCDECSCAGREKLEVTGGEELPKVLKLELKPFINCFVSWCIVSIIFKCSCCSVVALTQLLLEGFPNTLFVKDLWFVGGALPCYIFCWRIAVKVHRYGPSSRPDTQFCSGSPDDLRFVHHICSLHPPGTLR